MEKIVLMIKKKQVWLGVTPGVTAVKKEGQGGQQARHFNHPTVRLFDRLSQRAVEFQNKGGPEMSLHGSRNGSFEALLILSVAWAL